MNDTKTIQLFEMSVCRPTLEELAKNSMQAIKSLFEQRRPIVLGYSSGRTVRLSLTWSSEWQRTPLRKDSTLS